MAKNKILEATNGIVAILDTLDSNERSRVIQAALTVLGETFLPIPNPPDGVSGVNPVVREIQGSGLGSVTPKNYFDSKVPKSKGEELATAARFREEYANAETSTKDELKSVIKDARRNFDSANFKRDIDNARRKGLFNKGTGIDAAVLSHYGQNYVDAMPDRDAIKKLRKPKGARGAGKKKAGKKKAGKKKAIKKKTRRS